MEQNQFIAQESENIPDKRDDVQQDFSKMSVSTSDTHKAVENVEHTYGQVATPKKQRGKKVKEFFSNYFTATRIAYLAVFTALSFVLRLPPFEFSIFPAVPFLQIDFSNTFVMIAGFALGPTAGVIVGVLKELLYGISFSQTVGIGELANVLFILSYILLPAIVYKKHKGIKVVILTLLGGSLLQVIMSVPINYLLNFPFYFTVMGESWSAGMDFYLSVWYWAVLFNLVKVVLITVATLLLYKPLSRLIKATNAKFVAIQNKHKGNDGKNAA